VARSVPCTALATLDRDVPVRVLIAPVGFPRALTLLVSLSALGAEALLHFYRVSIFPAEIARVD